LINNADDFFSRQIVFLKPKFQSNMSRYFIRLSYDGSNYHGWQMQQNAHSVQAELNDKLSTLLSQNINVVGCGRTDAGVHAREFYAHFELE